MTVLMAVWISLLVGLSPLGPCGPVAPVEPFGPCAPVAPFRLWNAKASVWLVPLPLLVTVTLGVPVLASTLADAPLNPGPDGP